MKTQRGNGRTFRRKDSQNYWIAYYLRGQEYRESAGTPDEKTATRFLKHRIREVGADTLGVRKFVEPKSQRVTVSELLDALLVDYKLRGKSGVRLLSNLKPLQEWFGTMRATELSSADVDRFIEHALVHGRRTGQDKPAKPSSVNRSSQLLSQSFKLAIANGQLTTAPRIRRLSERDNVRTGFFSDAEVRRVIANLPAHLQDFVLFGYLTGWRSGEIKSLLWSEVSGDVIRLRAENSKNRESRIVTFESGELAELMARRQAARGDSQYIFHCGHKDKQDTLIAQGEPIGDFRKSWASACRLSGVSGRLFHDLRRTAVREMLRSGVHESTARKISGHKTPSMLARYNIQSESDIREAMQLRETRIATQQRENRLAIPLATKQVQ
jgi:integrase